MDFGSAVLVNIAGEDNGIADLGEGLDKAAAGCWEAVPLVGAIGDRYDDHAIDHHVPLCRGGGEFIVEPLLLLRAQDAGILRGFFAVLAGID